MIEKIASVFAVDEWVNFESRYNITPSRLAPVIVDIDGTRVLDLCRWGLIPSWAREMKIGYKMINARCETGVKRWGKNFPILELSKNYPS